MASVTSFTAERLQAVADSTVVGGSVNEIGNLILTTRYGAQLDAGYVKGDTGIVGPDRLVNAGMIQAFGGTTPPSGWMICNGAEVSRTTYSELFTAIGVTYGVGNGTTTFNLPDLKGRVPVGLDLTQVEFDNLGEKGGAKTHTLTTAEMPAHTHLVTAKSGVDNLDFDGFSGGLAGSDFTTPFDQQTQSTGGGGAHNNLQPYNVVHFIISIGNVGAAAAAAEDYVGRGTTAERDTIFGVPGTDPTRVALANRKVVWFNTDTGWEEMYYAATGKAGLTALGLVAQATSGWYPTGPGPAMLWEPSTLNVATANGTFLGGWGWVRKRGGAAWWDTPDGKIVKILRYGRYAIRGWTVQGTGTLTSNWHLRVVGSDLTTIVKNVDGNAFPQSSGLYTRAHMEYDDVILEPNQHVGMYYAAANTVTVHVGGLVPQGQFSVRYLGPPLVTE